MTSDFSIDDAAAAELWTEVSWLRGLALRHGLAGGEADDVVQETLLSVADSGEAHRGRGWLRRVLERRIGTGRRAEGRRQLRERAAARPEADASDPAAAMEHLEFTRRLHDAVAGLPREDREVLALRFGAGLQPAEIAVTLQTTPNAVSTRLSRALGKLRVRLCGAAPKRSERLGGFAAAASLGEPLRHPASSLLRATTPAFPIVLMKKTLGLVVLLVALILGALALLPAGQSRGDGEPDTQLAQPSPSLVPIATTGGREQDPEDAEPPPTERAAVAPSDVTGGSTESVEPKAPVRLGRVSIEVREVHSGKPAQGVGIRLFRMEHPIQWFSFLAGTTDAAGHASFADVTPGRYIAYMERVTLNASNATETFDVVGGGEVRAAFLVDESQYTKGIVLNESGTTVPGASIWVGSGGGPVDHGSVTTKSGPDGRFVAKYVDGMQYLSASAPGYAPSYSAAKGVGQPTNADGEVVLVLGSRHGSLRGVVLGPSRAPLAGARLMLGSSQQGVDVEGAERGSYWTRPVRHGSSGEDGTFEFTDVHAGELALEARHPDTASWHELVTVVDGAAREITVELVQGGSVTGQVTDTNGTPVAGAYVELDGPHESAMTRADTIVDADGRFRLDHLLPGMTVLKAMGPDGEGVQQETIDIQDGVVHTWDPELEPTGQFMGTVVSAAGDPLEHWRVVTRVLEDGRHDGTGRGGKTDADGQFSFAPALGREYQLTVYPPGRYYGEYALRRSPITPTAEAMELVVPLARIPRGVLRGKLQDNAGAPAVGTVELIVETVPQTRLERPTAEDGSFEFQHLPAGEFALTLRSPNVPAHTVGRPEPLEAGEVRHLGDLTVGDRK